MPSSSHPSPRRRLRPGPRLLAAWLSASCLIAMAAGDAPSTYIPAPEVRSDMAQVVFFRRAGPPEAGPAHVYIDGAFHTALQPRDFVRLCLPAAAQG